MKGVWPLSEDCCHALGDIGMVAELGGMPTPWPDLTLLLGRKMTAESVDQV